MVAFALPSKMQAYDGYGLKASDGSWIGLNWDGSKLTGTLDGWNGKQFKVEAYWGNGNHPYGYAGSDYGINGDALYDANVTTDNAGYFKVNTSNKYNVTVYLDNNTFGNGPYRIVLNKDGSTPTFPTTLYIYSTSGPTKIGTATNNGSGQYVYTIELTKDQYFVLSTKNNGDGNWNTVNSDRYNPSTDTYASTTGGATSFINSTNGAWKVKETGTYEITVDWNTKKLTSTLADTIPETLYLVNDGNAGTQTATNDGSNVFTYSVYFHAMDRHRIQN